MTWWESNRLRLVQNNLREVDADLDVDLLIKELKAFDANVLMMNTGGMFAFYPSALEYQYVTPFLKKDLLKETIEKAHANGIRFIARFDFSKAHESIFQQQPEWFYRTEAGDEVNYHGIVHTCLNGGYQQQYSLKILEEALTDYDVDGVFFNMFGYQNWDYSGNEYGICHCNNCRKRFSEMYGLDLPGKQTVDQDVFAAYRSFQRETAADILDKIHAKIKSLRPQAAICTYHPHKVDIVRHESNTSLTRPHPKWLYSAAENVMPVMGSYTGKLVSNCSINAIDLTYRFTGVSAYETEIRLYENIMNGSGLDFCIIGAFEGYPDGANLDKAKEIFRFHGEHEHLFGQFRSASDVVLVKPSSHAAQSEYLGLFKMLKEAHILFDVVKQERLAHITDTEAVVVVLPGLQELGADELETLTALRRRGIHIAATGAALMNQPEALDQLFDAEAGVKLTDTTAAYVQIDDSAMFPDLEKRSWVILSGVFTGLRYSDHTRKRLPMVAASSFGPPERAYGHQLTEQYALGIAEGSEGIKGRGAYVGWKVGELYYQHGFADHKAIVVGLLDELLQGRRKLQTNAHTSVEMTLHGLPDGTWLLQLLNLSGFNGVTYNEPVPMGSIEVTLDGEFGIREAEGMGSAVDSPRLVVDGGRTVLHISELKTYGAYHLK